MEIDNRAETKRNTKSENLKIQKSFTVLTLKKNSIDTS